MGLHRVVFCCHQDNVGVYGAAVMDLLALGNEAFEVISGIYIYYSHGK